jgi:hypothetical protein
MVRALPSCSVELQSQIGMGKPYVGSNMLNSTRSSVMLLEKPGEMVAAVLLLKMVFNSIVS